MTEQKAQCSRGWANRCPKAKSPKCTCACGGENHGNPAARFNHAKNSEVKRYYVPANKNMYEETGIESGPGRIIGLRLYVRTEDGRNESRPVVFFNNFFLDPAPSQEECNHSPDGFEWGYGGSGPSQLALAIALRICDNKQKARGLYQAFKHEVIAGLPKDGFALELENVRQWFATH